jgi:hypothetical protein
MPTPPPRDPTQRRLYWSLPAPGPDQKLLAIAQRGRRSRERLRAGLSPNPIRDIQASCETADVLE